MWVWACGRLRGNEGVGVWGAEGKCGSKGVGEAPIIRLQSSVSACDRCVIDAQIFICSISSDAPV